MGRFTVTDPAAPLLIAEPAIAGLAAEIMATALALTPEDATAGDRGDLRAGWRTQKSAEGWDVLNDTDYAMFVEFGSIHNPVPAGMLGQAIETHRGTRL